MASVDDLRKEIDVIDDAIMDLLDKRYHLTTQIGIEKKKLNTSVLDQNREQLIYDKTSKFSHSPQIKNVYTTIMAESKTIQRK